MITLTDDAAEKFKVLLKDKGLNENAAVRFLVKGGGCSGFTLEVEIEPAKKYDLSHRNDNKFVSNGVRILIDKKSSIFLYGMVVRYEKQPFGHKFVYDNPNSTGVCGCGESFSV